MLPNDLAFKCSKDAIILYCYIVDSVSDIGECAVYGVGGQCGLKPDKCKKAFEELYDKEFIDLFYRMLPIAELCGGLVITDEILFAKLSHVPKFQSRLSPEAWSKLRSDVFARDDYTCVYCKERCENLECDHVEPIASGGTNELGNLVTACGPCNKSKRDKQLYEWNGRVRDALVAEQYGTS